MDERRTYRKVKKRNFTLKNDLRYFVYIFFICLLIGFVLAFITGRFPSFLNRTIQEQADQVTVEKITKVKSQMSEEDLEKIVKKYKDAVKNNKTSLRPN
jgi:hypothetical protein